MSSVFEPSMDYPCSKIVENIAPFYPRFSECVGENVDFVRDPLPTLKFPGAAELSFIPVPQIYNLKYFLKNPHNFFVCLRPIGVGSSEGVQWC